MPARFNTANVLLLAGFGLLASSFFVPHWTGRRVARIEGRAHEVAAALLRCARELDALDLTAPATRTALAESFRAVCADVLGLPDSAMPELVDDEPPRAAEPRILFRGKHYLHALTRQPPPVPQPLDYDPAAPRPLEVYAWPAAELGPARSAFFFAEDGLAAFTRNLRGNYRGQRRAPAGGSGRPREGERDPWAFVGADGLRWLRLPAP